MAINDIRRQSEEDIIYGPVANQQSDIRHDPDRMHDSVMKNRDFGADVVRVLSCLLVLILHFFLRNGFYYREIVDG